MPDASDDINADKLISASKPKKTKTTTTTMMRAGSSKQPRGKVKPK